MIEALFADWNSERSMQLLALVGAATAFVVGLVQYRKAQLWKRAEWVARELKAFLADPQVDAALKMIDWSARDISLFPGRPADQRMVLVESQEVITALRHHSECTPGDDGRRFSEKEAAIRDAFDGLCDGLERIEAYIEARLVTEDDVAPYLNYWGEHVRPDSNEPRIRQVRKYMASYGWEGAEKLLDRFGPRVKGSSGPAGSRTSNHR